MKEEGDESTVGGRMEMKYGWHEEMMKRSSKKQEQKEGGVETI